MPAKDELARRRHEKLVDRLERLVLAGLMPQYEGYYGQLILSRDDLSLNGRCRSVPREAASRELARHRIKVSSPISRLAGGLIQGA
ncbi:hypothetical protein KBY55_30605 [Streptomyces sp. b94]|uniref:hypothetical protein n=1 Tax=Streptomyces sp. b94 TaxID=1827634 RepID=UPI001B392315|nr:hypothetical protein [Streptomyces sp. b94]MBQ1100302.1 hypothetical protein [Streptomyces sp. b94]